MREWLQVGTLITVLGIVASLALRFGALEERVINNGKTANTAVSKIDSHIDQAAEAFKDLARIASALDSRVSRIEGREEARHQ